MKVHVQAIRNLVFVMFAVTICQSAHAMIIKMDFTAADFPGGAPQDPVSGTFSWEATSISDPINSLISVDLTINGYTYNLSELGFLNDPTGFNGHSLIGGLLNGVGIAASGTNDFFFLWNRTTSQPDTFTYTTDNTDRGWVVSVLPQLGQFTQFSLTAVPEPPTQAIMLAGLAGIAAACRRGKKR
ncbi:MAG: PEP-CTERM sorting domain-containing protein [Candidatus Competibacteraceae bacterium]